MLNINRKFYADLNMQTGLSDKNTPKKAKSKKIHFFSILDYLLSNMTNFEREKNASRRSHFYYILDTATNQLEEVLHAVTAEAERRI